ncbi:uncharacterized protein LOC120834320 [Gasterosteus aculeatus]
MENYFCINWKFSIICCMSWISSLAERSTISREVGSRVILPCKTESNVTLVQLTWKTNGVTLFSFQPPDNLHISNESTHRNINITDSPPKALLIENVQESHAGNYTCEFNTNARFQEQRWELIITAPGKSENTLIITVASAVPCVCCLIFILAWIILHRVRIQHAEGRSPPAEMEREETIYENCLRIDVRQQGSHNHPHRCQHRPR